MKRAITILLFIFSINTFAQYFTMGNDPANIKWRQIKTPAVRLVFDEQFEEQALKLAAYMDSITPYVSASLNYSPKRINILIHNHTPIANGFVSWAPRRSEFFSIPSQNNNSNLWLQHLAVHEYRHVVQMNKLNTGITKLAGCFIGQQAVGAVGGVLLPMWFLEGDAVITETALSNSGRGRSFDFINPVKAQIIEKKIYPYDKSYLGSYKDKLPNYYQMGYLLTAQNREKYGAELWEEAVYNTGKNAPFIHPFDRKIRKITGQKKRKLFYNTFNELKNEWIEELENQYFTDFKIIETHKNKSDYIDFKNLNFANDSILLAEVSGPGTRTHLAFINLNNGDTKIIKHLGYRNQEPISLNKNQVVWTEIKYDKRWELKATSVIYTYNLKSRKTKKITKEQQYFSPSLHSDKNLIVAVESTIENNYFVTILDSNNGKVIDKIATPNNFYPISPCWNEDDDNIIVILLSEDGKAFYSLDLENRNWEMLTSHNFDEKRNPIFKDAKIIYSAKGAISDELFEYDIKTKETKQITSSKYGANFPAIINNKIAYSYLTADGWRLAVHTNKDRYIEIQKSDSSMVDKLAAVLKKQEIEKSIDIVHTEQDYEVEKYSKWNLFNFHSWAPIYYNIDDFDAYAGATIMSQNLLNSTVLTASYNANPAKRKEKYRLNLTYSGFYPIFEVDAYLGDEPFEMKGLYSYKDKFLQADVKARFFHYKASVGVKIPLYFQKNNFRQLLQFSSKYILNHRTSLNFSAKEIVFIDENEYITTGKFQELTYKSFDFQGLEYSAFFQNIRLGTQRDVDTRMGQLINFTYRHAPLGDYNNGAVLGVVTRLYLPGFGKYDAFSLGNDFQHIINGSVSSYFGEFVFYNRPNQLINYPRGYNYLYSDDLYVLRANYHFLVWNPDISIGPLFYVKRIRNQFFTDQAFYSLKTYFVNNKPYVEYFKSASYGTELRADVHLFQSTLNFVIGARVGVRDMDNKFFGDFLFSFSL